MEVRVQKSTKEVSGRGAGRGEGRGRAGPGARGAPARGGRGPWPPLAPTLRSPRLAAGGHEPEAVRPERQVQEASAEEGAHVGRRHAQGAAGLQAQGVHGPPGQPEAGQEGGHGEGTRRPCAPQGCPAPASPGRQTGLRALPPAQLPPPLPRSGTCATWATGGRTSRRSRAWRAARRCSRPSPRPPAAPAPGLALPAEGTRRTQPVSGVNKGFQSP